MQFTSRSSTRPSKPTPRLSDAEWKQQHEMRRALSKANSALPRYNDALCNMSKRLRIRSLPPPPPPPYHDPVQPRLYIHGSRPALRLEETRPANLEYYKKYIKSVYEREPLFEQYLMSLPPEERNPYNMESLLKIRTEFEDMLGDKWQGETGNNSDVAEVPEGGIDLYPYRNAIMRDRVPASERLRLLHADRRRDLKPDPLPKLRVFHRSTWPEI